MSLLHRVSRTGPRPRAAARAHALRSHRCSKATPPSSRRAHRTTSSIRGRTPLAQSSYHPASVAWTSNSFPSGSFLLDTSDPFGHEEPAAGADPPCGCREDRHPEHDHSSGRARTTLVNRISVDGDMYLAAGPNRERRFEPVGGRGELAGPMKKRTGGSKKERHSCSTPVIGQHLRRCRRLAYSGPGTAAQALRAADGTRVLPR